MSEKAAIQELFALPKLPWDKTVKRWFPPLQVKPSNGAAKPLSTYFRSFQKKNEKKNDNKIVMSDDNAMLEKMNSIKRKQISLPILGISSTYLF